jgi:hypothetical protein
VQTLVQLGDDGSSIRCRLTLRAEWLPIAASAWAEATAAPGRLIKIDTARLARTLGILLANATSLRSAAHKGGAIRLAAAS